MRISKKRFSKYIASFDYLDKFLIALSVASGAVSIEPFACVIGALVGTASASFIFEFLSTTGIINKLLKATQNKKKKHNFFLPARSKLNSTENKISKTLTDNETSHEDLTIIINEERKYLKFKENIRMMKSQRSNIEKKKLVEIGKNIGIDGITRHYY